MYIYMCVYIYIYIYTSHFHPARVPFGIAVITVVASKTKPNNCFFFLGKTFLERPAPDLAL